MSDAGALNSKKRLAQIVAILRKHHITQGLSPEKLRLIIEDLGPTFVKIGQIMSTRQDMFSQRYCKELKKLRSNVNPLPFEVIAEVIEEEYASDIQDIFINIEKNPLGSASIAQVHRATLKKWRTGCFKGERPQYLRNDGARYLPHTQGITIATTIGNIGKCCGY